jgi:predicted nucleic acid-binding protein
LKAAYFDTNIFIASYKPDDKYYEESSVIVEALKGGEIKGQTSTLTILETAAVASRTIQIHKGDDEKEVRRRAVGKAILSLSRLGLGFIHLPGDSSAPIDSHKVEMPAIFHQALLLASKIGLRSFDLVHLATAKYSSLTDSEVSAFVTGDAAFLRQKKDLSDLIDMPILSPREFIQAIGLKRE